MSFTRLWTKKICPPLLISVRMASLITLWSKLTR